MTAAKKNNLKSSTKSTNGEAVFYEPDAKSAYADWLRDRVTDSAAPNWLWVTVNISNEKLRLAYEFGSRRLLLDRGPTTNPTIWMSNWSTIWQKFFLKLEKFGLKGKRSIQPIWFAVFENETKKANPKLCPSHSHLLVAVPANESLNAFVRRFCSAFNTYVYPLGVTDDSEWIWDVSRRQGGSAQVLNVQVVHDAEVTTYATKQIMNWGFSDRIELGSYRRLLDENNKTNEG
jgi:hypothetical protein